MENGVKNLNESKAILEYFLIIAPQNGRETTD